MENLGQERTLSLVINVTFITLVLRQETFERYINSYDLFVQFGYETQTVFLRMFLYQHLSRLLT
jgi:hypothetical protein